MKKILILVAALVLLALGALAFLLFNADEIIAKAKPQLEKTASDALGTNVAIGQLSLSLFPTAELSVEKLALTPRSPKGSGEKDGLVLEHVVVDIALLPLLSKTVEIEAIQLHSPQITLVQPKAGAAYIKGLPRRKSREKSNAQAAEPAPAQAASEQSKKTSIPVAVNLKSFRITGGAVSLQDEKAGETRKIQNIDLSTNVRLEDSKVHSDALSLAAVLPDDEPLSFSSDSVSFDLATQELNFAGLFLDFREAQFSTKGQVSLQPLAGEIEANAFEGSLKTTFSADLQEKKTFQTNGAVEGIVFERALTFLQPQKEPALSGKLRELTFDMKGKTEGDIPASLVGTVNAQVADGEIRGVNIAASVLKELTQLPFVSEAIEEEFTEEQRQDLSGPNTTFQNIRTDLELNSGTALLQSFSIEAHLFALQAKGEADMEGNFQLNSSLFFAPALSEILTAKIKEFRSVTDEQGRVVIPVELRGKPGSIKVLPDMKKLAELGVKAVAKEAAGKLLEKTFGDEGGEGAGKAIGDLLGF